MSTLPSNILGDISINFSVHVSIHCVPVGLRLVSRTGGVDFSVGFFICVGVHCLLVGFCKCQSDTFLLWLLPLPAGECPADVPDSNKLLIALWLRWPINIGRLFVIRLRYVSWLTNLVSGSIHLWTSETFYFIGFLAGFGQIALPLAHALL